MRYIILIITLLVTVFLSAQAPVENNALSRRPFDEPTIQAASGTAFGEKVIEHNGMTGRKNSATATPHRRAKKAERYNYDPEAERRAYSIDRTTVNRPYTGSGSIGSSNGNVKYGRTGDPISTAMSTNHVGNALAMPSVIATPDRGQDIQSQIGSAEVADDDVVEIGPVSYVNFGDSDGDGKYDGENPEDRVDAGVPVTDAIPFMLLMAVCYSVYITVQRRRRESAE